MEQSTRKSLFEQIELVILTAALMMILFNSLQISSIKSEISLLGKASTGAANVVASRSGSENLTAVNVMPTGMPRSYGAELGVSFDDVSVSNPQKADAVLSKLGALENQISLSGDELQRYITITQQISCEYCCGAKAITFENGQPACGCAHSAAMRGLTKYLVKNHPNDYSDDQILEELGKWKTLFFPDVMTQKAKVLQDKGIELNYINLASNKYRGIEQGSSGGSMVGGC